MIIIDNTRKQLQRQRLETKLKWKEQRKKKGDLFTKVLPFNRKKKCMVGKF